MALIVGVHGIAQQTEGAPALLKDWWPWLESGVDNAKRKVPANALALAFYGGLFRAAGQYRGTTADDEGDADDQAFDRELVMEVWAEAARAEPRRVPAPTAAVRAGVPLTIQKGLNALSNSTFFAGIADHLMLGSLRQVRRYLKEPEIRLAAQTSVDDVVTAETRVLVGHSLGSVVSYEALHRYASSTKWANIHTFITLGSPLGIQNLIFHRLDPKPEHGKGAWPALIKRWVNISDDRDVVALQKRLQQCFSGNIVDIQIDNEATAHNVRPYLTSANTGEAIADGLL